jgi:nucleoside-diphosphate-sugar epimerase
MRLLLTGVTGFVGEAIASHLYSKGHEIFGVHARYRETKLHEKYKMTLADVGSLGVVEKLRQEIPQCDAVIHAAASLNMDLFAIDVVLTNCLGVHNMLSLASQWGCKRFVFLSSLPVIGVPKILPIDEEHPTNPATSYHASKLFGEQLVGLAALRGLNSVSLRLSAPVGPGMPKGRLLNVLVSRAVNSEIIELQGHGTRQQNYVDVRDISSAVELCLENPISGVFNIASASCISNIDLALRCIDRCHSGSEIVFTGVTDLEEGYIWAVSIEKARNKLGYVPQYGIDEAIDAAVADLRKDKGSKI